MSASQFSIKSVQRRVRKLFLDKQGLGTPTLAGLSAQEATITDNGPGDYTINISKTFNGDLVDIIAVLGLRTADAIAYVSAVTKNSVRVLCFDATDGTTAKEADFFIEITGSEIEDRYSDSDS